MTENNYMYLSMVLAIIAIVFAVLYFTKPDQTIGEVYGGVSDNVMTCNENVAKWKEKYASIASSTEKQEALTAVLDDCQDELAKGKQSLEE